MTTTDVISSLGLILSMTRLYSAAFWAICETLNPAIAVDAYHDRSVSSRRSAESSPFTIPLVSLSERTGTYWRIPCFAMATILSPGLILASCRSFSGITTWYFLDTLTVSIVSLCVQRHYHRYKRFCDSRPAVRYAVAGLQRVNSEFSKET